MMRVLFGALLGLLAAYPALLEVVLGIAGAAASSPVVLAFAVGVVAWPRLARTVRGWAT